MTDADRFPFDKRDQTILRMVADAYSIKQIATALGVHARTVDGRLQVMRDHVETWSTTALVATALRRGWIT